MRKFFSLVLVAGLAGCAGKVDYVRPNQPQNFTSQRTIDKPRDAVWSASVPELGKQFFVINNLDKSSGLINVSYSGDPESYVDCGHITSFVKNVRGERTYDFPGSRAQQSYELMNGSGLFIVERKMSLEGRVNLVFEEVSQTQTKVTASTRYIINRNQTARNTVNNIPRSFSDSISFNSNSRASFPSSDNDGRATECVSTGKLEREILSVLK